jgi:hypothetical protein
VRKRETRVGAVVKGVNMLQKPVAVNVAVVENERMQAFPARVRNGRATGSQLLTMGRGDVGIELMRRRRNGWPTGTARWKRREKGPEFGGCRKGGRGGSRGGWMEGHARGTWSCGTETRGLDLQRAPTRPPTGIAITARQVPQISLLSAPMHRRRLAR